MSSSETIADRVGALVQRVHGGSVNAAARDSGVPQRTLARIVAGQVENPRSDVLQKLASYYRASLEWLVTGDGRGPEIDYGISGEYFRNNLRIRNLLRDISLSERATENVLSASTTLQGAAFAIAGAATGAARLPARFGRPLELEQELWAEWLERSVEAHGAEAVASWLESNAAMLARSAVELERREQVAATHEGPTEKKSAAARKKR